MGNPILHSPPWNHFKPHIMHSAPVNMIAVSVERDSCTISFHSICQDETFTVGKTLMMSTTESYEIILKTTFSPPSQNIKQQFSLQLVVCIVSVIWRCCKPFSQWQRSLQMKSALPLAAKLATAWGRCCDNTPRTSRIFIILNTFGKATNQQLRSVTILLPCPVNM